MLYVNQLKLLLTYLYSGRFSHFYEEFQDYVDFNEGHASDDSYEIPK